MSTAVSPVKLRDLKSDQEVKWCPGCGNYSIWTQLLKTLADHGVRREQMCVVSGIGCSSRFPYYVSTYGFHGIHGRAPAIASGIKLANPELDVWVVTGDGDALSIGGNHFLHTIRRNMGLKIILFNNRIYGLTKGQASPTSEFGKRTKSTPYGTAAKPINPICVAIGSEATFVARCIDMDTQHTQAVFRRAIAHRGTAFVEIYQNCAVFNAGAFDYVSNQAARADHLLYLEHGEPMIFGRDRDKGIRLNGVTPEVVSLLDGVSHDDLLVHDEHASEPTLAYLLSRMRQPDFPEPVGVFRAVEAPTYEQIIGEQIAAAREREGVGDLRQLLAGGESWEVS